MNTITDAFLPLYDELSLWQNSGLACRLWWRDDDLVQLSPNLQRMHALSQQYGAAVLVAVIPEPMDEALGRDTAGMRDFTWCQHGLAHRNHEPPGVPNSEFPTTRPASKVTDDLLAGKRLMAERFGDRFLPVLVPPWNAFREDLIDTLASLGYLGISQYGARPAGQDAPLVRVNAHLDVVDWSAAPAFPAHRTAFLLARLVELLRQRRAGDLDREEATGILTHHRAMDDAAWVFMDALLKITRRFSCVRWLSPSELFRTRSRT